ncbi:alpha/beta family hydrolase [Frankia sp. R82]|uniref:alpha/beta hydrolase family protein n=1 Tax=Frankia sp. R82 TaxID=2950553 RepID=UPI0035AB7BDA
MSSEDAPAVPRGAGRESAAEVHTAVDGGRLRLVPGSGPAVVFLHGAGSGVDTPLFGALAAELTAGGVRVGRLEMPYRVAGRRAPDRAARLDAVALAALAIVSSGRDVAGPATGDRPDPGAGDLAEGGAGGGTGRPFALAGVSMGSRVAVRVGRQAGARGVLALGFPLRPPGRTATGTQKPSRQGELDDAGLPVLVVQGDRDPFGLPDPDPSRARLRYLVAGGDHSMRTRIRDGRPPGDAIAEAARVGAAYLLDRLGLPRPEQPSVLAGTSVPAGTGGTPGRESSVAGSG